MNDPEKSTKLSLSQRHSVLTLFTLSHHHHLMIETPQAKLS